MASNVDHQAVLDFFKSSIPTLVPGPNHISSTGTRPPAKFDKHLHTKLTLKRVLYCPSLVDDFAAIADDALSQYLLQQSLPSTNDDVCETGRFPGKRVRDVMQREIEASINDIINEESIRSIYAAILIPYCLTVASTLEFQLPIWSSGCLAWELVAYTKENFGIPDGFFQIKNSPTMAVPSSYEKTKEHFSNVAVWEFKNLKAGNEAVFQCIRELARLDQFPWVTCEAGHLCGVKCKSPPDSREAMVYWKKCGPDAPSPICKSTCMESSAPLPEITIPFTSAHALHAEHMMQQVWAEMVKYDATFACLTSGHLKMYCYRKRDNGWLYISDVLSTDSENTAKYLTGFLIAALRDARERATELENNKPATWAKENPFKAVQTEENMSQDLAPEEVLSQAKVQQWLVLYSKMKPEYRSGSFLTTTLYQRGFPHLNASAGQPDTSKCLLVSITGDRHTSKGTFQVNGISFSGIPGQYAEHVVVKTANAEGALSLRKNEYQIILDLKAANVTCIPDALGCFWYADPGRRIKPDYAAFIFEDVGEVSLDELWAKKRQIDKKYVDAAKDGLRQIHKAGYRHRNLSLCDIIVRDCIRSDRSVVSFVNFGRAKRVSTPVDSKEKGKMKKEEEQLESLLLNPLKR
ncbi:hypothetical protein C0995_010858, partial [Termitomyces sp. Mi166